MEKPLLVKAKVLSKSLLTDDVVRLRIKNIDPMKVAYNVGQYISLKVPEGVYRSYSVFNYDDNINAFDIAAKVAHSGPGANYIKAISTGTDVQFVGPTGRFILDTESEEVYLFATGTGITPFLAYLRFLDNSYIKPQVTLFWGLNNKDDIFLEDIIYSYTMSIPKFSHQIYLSQSENSFQYRKGRVTDAIEKLEYGEDAKFYLCGNPHMIEDSIRMLKEKGISEDKIFFEKYTWAEGEDSEGDISEGEILEE